MPGGRKRNAAPPEPAGRPSWVATLLEKQLATAEQRMNSVVHFFFLYLLMFWTTMYINYPRAGDDMLDIVPEFNSLSDSFTAMVNLGVASGKLLIDLTTPEVYHIDDADVVLPLVLGRRLYGPGCHL